RGHTGGVFAVALSADGRLVVSGGFDGTVRLWDSARASWLRTLQADRRYDGLDITRLSGITDAQRTALLALGAVERASQSVWLKRDPLPVSHAGLMLWSREANDRLRQ